MGKNVALAIVVATALVGGVVLLINSQAPTVPTEPTIPKTPSPTELKSREETSVKKEETVMGETVVAITGSGFTPQTVTIKVGETVRWMNNDTVVHNVLSVVHPTHLVYPPLNLGNVEAGSSVILSFSKAGTYRYHDHLNPGRTGVVVVE